MANMHIYLVHVELRDGKLSITRKLGTTDDNYIAISHVWGDPQTIQKVHVEGVGIVQLSSVKSHDILSILSRPDICGNDWFWMDLFCIDQDENASISVTDQLMAIPAIYKSSRCVKVLIESPICKEWHATASRGNMCTQWPSFVSGVDPEAIKTFEQWELLHSRKCRGMLFLDPWFERLWTRQEGLYAGKLQMIILNPAECSRQNTTQSDELKWTIEGHNSLKRDSVYNFLDDKLRYHGVQPTESDRFHFYLDLVYRGGIVDRRILDIANYGGVSGPVAGYSPIERSWRSGRRTSKTRDYVLAVLPDIEGYRVPEGARRWPFEKLLCNALEQIETLSHSGAVALKVTNGVGGDPIQPSDSFGIYTLDFPNDITEAFDCLAALMTVSPGSSIPPSINQDNVSNILRCGSTTFIIASNSITLSPVKFTRANLPNLVQKWTSTANFYNHIPICAPSGPCLGTSRSQDDKSLLHRYLAFQFTGPFVKDMLSTGNYVTSTPHGVVNLDKLENRIPGEAFALYFQHFMACLICGVTLRTAEEILANAEFRMVKTSALGSLLALINKGFLRSSESETRELVLVTRGLHQFEGFHLAVRDGADGSCRVVGRTWIPQDLDSGDVNVLTRSLGT